MIAAELTDDDWARRYYTRATKMGSGVLILKLPPWLAQTEYIADTKR